MKVIVVMNFRVYASLIKLDTIALGKIHNFHHLILAELSTYCISSLDIYVSLDFIPGINMVLKCLFAYV